MPTEMGDKETTVVVTPLEESECRMTWGNDMARETGRNWSWSWTWGLRLGWASLRKTAERAADAASSLGLHTTYRFDRGDVPALIKYLCSKKQWLGLVLFSVGGIMPMILLGYYTPGSFWFEGVFRSKTLWCGNNFMGEPQNSKVDGIEGFFVLDSTYGKFSFAGVKTIDVVWDILVGRGVQIMAWWVTYVVFSDALLRVIERHATSFEVFQRIALEGASLHSLWTLFKELWTVRSKRTKALFCYMLLTTSYVLCIPMFIGAMTGYDSKTSAWIDPDGTNNLIPTSALSSAWVISGNDSSAFDQRKCVDNEEFYAFVARFSYQARNCDCKLPDGTVMPAEPNFYTYYDPVGPTIANRRKPCRFDYPGATKTFKVKEYGAPETVQHCNATMDVKVDGVMYDAQSLDGTSGWCYEKTGWRWDDLAYKSKCLPDTANPTYEWGYSTMLSGVFVLIHFAWSVTMYMVWQHAQLTSTLVQSGYNMTPLRAAFAMAKAAKHKTGLGEGQLVRANTRDLEKELYGHRSINGTKVDYNLFIENIEDQGDAEGRMMFRRRPVLNRNGTGSQETLASPELRFDEK